MSLMKNYRLSKGYSRREMADLLNISLSQYDKVEFNQRFPSNTFLKKFKKTFPEFDMNIFFELKHQTTCINAEHKKD